MLTAPSRTPVPVTVDRMNESVEIDTFLSAFRMHPSGVAVITADDGGRPAAMTISSLASASTEPPLVVFSLSKLSGGTPTFLAAESIVIHLLASEQLWLAQLGATRGADRFADTSRWTRLPTGEPVFHDTFAWLRGRIVHRLEAGNSIISVAHIVQASVPGVDALAPQEAAPLVYHARTWFELGPNAAVTPRGN